MSLTSGLLRPLLAAVFFVSGLLCDTPASAQSDRLIVFAAASLKDALDEINADWAVASGSEAAISYAGSSALAKQIESGAPADLFISADLAWMDYLTERKLVSPESRAELVGNRMVLVAPGTSDIRLAIEAGFDIAGALGGGKLAMANTDSVPAGKYGKAALVSLGVWDSVEASVAQAENVRAALQFVARGETPLGIVYRSDAAAEQDVRVVDVFPADLHPAIVYPAALTADSTHRDAPAFLEHLKSAAASRVFERRGFTALTP